MNSEGRDFLILVGGAVLLLVVLAYLSRSAATSPAAQAQLTAVPNPYQPALHYVNEERWELKRDFSGRLQEIVVHRDARQQ